MYITCILGNNPANFRRAVDGCELRKSLFPPAAILHFETGFSGRAVTDLIYTASEHQQSGSDLLLSPLLCLGAAGITCMFQLTDVDSILFIYLL